MTLSVMFQRDRFILWSQQYYLNLFPSLKITKEICLHVIVLDLPTVENKSPWDTMVMPPIICAFQLKFEKALLCCCVPSPHLMQCLVRGGAE